MSTPLGGTLIRVFDHFADAERARGALLADGFAPHAVQLDAGDDEAGPVQGNFTVGNRDTLTGRLERAINTVFGGDNHMYGRNYGTTAFRGMFRLIVAVGTAQERERAHAIVQACNGCDIEQRTASHAGGRRADAGAHALAG
ncbi:hypothetical protein GQ37_009725 [Janthinobacterium sp. BJB1]|uniref:hypothetical protein n=1 Tax=Janthinobacterium sp. GW458P TaxID=1981504 RepID=UPI000A325EFB|nr:hypothetical protein [Janthinobacterium sp. GW458P]MBE3026337.1 hypothetical protein [Janthinobacterium sp. GW458P]PHV17305.1 hypothetical protein CSQ90_08265 [Janthinobacterium sp. BJB303]PJC98630.1 hypothetical protein GQ37_009725 [Janthinobacterium sp. BJB1]